MTDPTTTTMPDWDEMFPGYFNANHFEDGRELTLQIYTIIKDDLPVIGNGGSPTGETAEKWVMLFRDNPNRLVINQTNQGLIGAMLGKRTSEWIGKRITLHSEPGCGFGKPGVRVCGSPDIAEDVKARLGLKPKPNRVYTLRRTGDAPAPDLATVIRNAGTDRDHLDAWLLSKDKPTTADISDEDGVKLRDALLSNKGKAMLAAIKAMDLTPADDTANHEAGADGEF